VLTFWDGSVSTKTYCSGSY